MKTPKAKRGIDGRAFSPVVHADSKFFGSPPHLCVDVRFANAAQLDALIAALISLREFPSDGFDHVHLQDNGLAPSRIQTALAEVTFWHPSVQRTERDDDCVSSAQRVLASLPCSQ